MAFETKKKQGEPQSLDQQKAVNGARRPFDTGELKRIPMPTEQDPPYRSWWVVDDAYIRMAISKRSSAV